MRIKLRRRQKEPECGSGTYRVQLFSRRALLIKEFCLDARENGLHDIEAAEEHLRQTLNSGQSSPLTVALTDESPDRHNHLQFDIKPL